MDLPECFSAKRSNLNKAKEGKRSIAWEGRVASLKRPVDRRSLRYDRMSLHPISFINGPERLTHERATFETAEK